MAPNRTGGVQYSPEVEAILRLVAQIIGRAIKAN